MAITVIEKANSRKAKLTGGFLPQIESATFVYGAWGSHDELQIRSAVLNVSPAFYGTLLREDMELTPTGGGHWEVEVNYKFQEDQEENQDQQRGGLPDFNFEISANTIHITQAINHVSSKAAPGSVVENHFGAIGWDGESVQGTDIYVPTFSFGESHVLPVEQVTFAYVRQLFRLTAKVNNSTFRGFDAGEVLFLGASGQFNGEDAWSLSFKFVASENVTNLTIGDITGIDKKGWEYLWVEYKDSTSGKRLTKVPRQANVEQVYRTADFSLLGIGV